MSEHTQTPWHVHDMEAGIICGVDHLAIADCNAIFKTREQNIVNALFIVHTVNCHQALVDACKGLLMTFGEYAGSGEYPDSRHPNLVNARSILAKAEETK